MALLTFIIYGIATWRLSSLLVNEAGPGDIFVHLREFAGIAHDDQKQKTIIPDGFFSGILSCVWCCSVWVGAFWMLFDLLFPTIALRCAVLFGFSALAIFIQVRLEK